MATSKRHVALVGFMGSGKSTIGEQLARALGRRFVDVDEEIVRAHGAIDKIFAEEGEVTFRRYERSAIAAALASHEPSVIAVGGGAPAHAPTRKLLAERAHRIFLRVSPQTVERRLRRAKVRRPMLGESPTRARITTLYERRLPYYREAEFTLDCSGLQEGTICEALASQVRLGYPVVIARDARPALRRAIRAHGGSCIIVCDAKPAIAALARTILPRLPVHPFALQERRKRLALVERTLDVLAASGCDRETLVVGVGGGVASDLFGLAAGLYMRGVPYVHLATSLVAMVDAAIGGKTGVDLRAGKNLAGIFRDPAAVFAQVDALETLPPRAVREGLSEVVKAAIIADPALFATLERLEHQPFSRWPWQRIVRRAVEIKSSIVSQDPQERGARELLNLGHTFGHAYERESAYRLAHGAAVALGLRAAGLLALRLGRFSASEHARVVALLAALGMSLRASASPRSVLRRMQHDKKRREGRLRFVLPNKIGSVSYGVEAPESDVLAVLREMNEPAAP